MSLPKHLWLIHAVESFQLRRRESLDVAFLSCAAFKRRRGSTMARLRVRLVTSEDQDRYPPISFRISGLSGEWVAILLWRKIPSWVTKAFVQNTVCITVLICLRTASSTIALHFVNNLWDIMWYPPNYFIFKKKKKNLSVQILPPWQLLPVKL